MRNRLIHAYFDVDPAILLETAQSDLSPLITMLETVLDAEASEAQSGEAS